MKTIQFAKFGDPSVLELVEKPKLTRKSNEALIKVVCAAVNVIDCKERAGKVPFTKLPKVPGGDVAGIVLEAPEASQFSRGDKVFALCRSYRPNVQWGTYSDYVCVPVDHLAKCPDAMSFQQAAAMPLVALTAWQALDAAKLSAGDHVLVHAGAGGVGSSVIQLAKVRGLKVTTTASAENIDFLAELGADHVIDYKAHRFEDVIQKPVHCVIDTVGGDYEPRSLALLSKQGCFIFLF